MEIILLADDLAILVGEDMNLIESVMNVALKVLQDWILANEMEVNMDKTKYQIFEMKNNIAKPRQSTASRNYMSTLPRDCLRSTNNI